MMQVRGLRAGYGGSQVLRGVDFELAPAEILAVLGRNGSGRSTLARALMGLVPCQGEVLWRGRNIAGWPTHRIARSGIGYVPESRDVFADLTVLQNLQLGLPVVVAAPGAGPGWTLDTVLGLFPALQVRLGVPAGSLSGGEQQMLALARSLLGNPRLLIVDEPTEGLAPAVVLAVAQCLQASRQRGMAVLLIEQKLSLAEALCERCLVMGQGQVRHDGSLRDLLAQPALRQAWLEV